MDLGADESHENRKLLGFCTAGVVFAAKSSYVHVQIRQTNKLLVGRCKDIMSHSEDILTLDVGGEALE